MLSKKVYRPYSTGDAPERSPKVLDEEYIMQSIKIIK
jgi:hypothetical protein